MCAGKDLVGKVGLVGAQQGPKLLVKWRSMPEEEATWMGETDFRAQFPTFSLEDKAAENGGGNAESTAGDPTLKVYTRRSKSGTLVTK